MTRRPMDGARKNNGDTAEHAWRGVDPATDYGADSGEPIYAPFAGRVGGWWSGTGGNTVQVVGDGVTFVGQHLNSRAVPIGTYVAEGALIGYTGSTGSATDGPHLHWWIEDHGTRISGETYMHRVGLGYTPVGSRTPNTSAAGDGGTSIVDQEEEEEDMSRNSGFFYTRADKKVVVLICNTDSGFEHEYSNGTSANGEYNGPVAGTFGTGSFAPITESHAIVLKRALKQVRDSSSVTIESVTANIDSKEIAANVEAGLMDDFAAIPKAVNDDSAQRLRE